MSVMVNVFHACEVGEWDDNLVTITSEGTITIYPKGRGIGPSISMEPEDWKRINDQVSLVLEGWMQQKMRGDS